MSVDARPRTATLLNLNTGGLTVIDVDPSNPPSTGEELKALAEGQAPREGAELEEGGYTFFWGTALVSETAVFTIAPLALDFMLAGAVQDDSAVVSVRGEDGASDIRVAWSTDQATWNYSAAVAPEAASGVAKCAITGLPADSTIYYRAEIDGDLKATEHTLRTLPAAGTAYDFTFAFGSCGHHDVDTDVYTRALAKNPLFFFSLGDTPYSDRDLDMETASSADIAGEYAKYFRLSNVANLLGSTFWNYVWDDHDFGEDNSGYSSGSRATVQSVYRAVHPHYSLPDSAAVYHSFQVGRALFITLDVRSERGQTAGTVLQPAQMAWLKGELDRVDGTNIALAVIANSAPWIATGTSDTWSDFAGQRTEIADYIENAGLTNRVVMISGDMHAVAYDDGTNNTFSTSGNPGFRVCHAAPLNMTNSQKGGPYTHGPFDDTQHQYGTLDLTDDGSEITVRFRGYDAADSVLVDQGFTTADPAEEPTVTLPEGFGNVVQSATEYAGPSERGWGGQVSVTLASAPQPGNLLFLAVGVDKNNGVLIAPSGWTMIDQAETASITAGMAYRVADGSETGPITISWNGNDNYPSLQVTEFQGPFDAAPLDVHDFDGAGATTTSLSFQTDAPALSAGLAVGFYTNDSRDPGSGDFATPTASAGFSLLPHDQEAAGGGTPVLFLAQKIFSDTDTGLSTTLSYPTENADQAMGGLVVFKPDAEVDTGDPGGGSLPEATLTTQSSIVDDGVEDFPASGMTVNFTGPVTGAKDEQGRWLIKFDSASDEITIPTGSGFSVAYDETEYPKNGCDLNPFSMSREEGYTQGLGDASGVDGTSNLVDYSSARNVDPDKTGTDLVIRAADWPDGVTLVKAISRPAGDYGGGDPFPDSGRMQFESYCIITFVPHDAVVPDRFYCPGPRQQDKRKIKSYWGADWSKRTEIDVTGHSVDLETFNVVDTFGLIIGDNESHRSLRTNNHIPTYGRELLGDEGEPMLALVAQGVSEAARRGHMRWLMPAAINALESFRYDVLTMGGNGYFGNGAHMGGRFQLATMAAILYQDTEWLEAVGYFPDGETNGGIRKGWHEKDQAYVISDGTLSDFMGYDWPVNDLERDHWGNENGRITDQDHKNMRFRPEHVGMPYYGEQHPNDPYRDDGRVNSRYGYQNYPPGVLANAATRTLENVYEVVNYPPVFAVQDRYTRLMRGFRDGSWPTSETRVYSFDGFIDDNLSQFDVVWDAANAVGNVPIWEGPPDHMKSPIVTGAGDNELTIQFDGYQNPNGGTITRRDVRVWPAIYTTAADRFDRDLTENNYIDFNDVTLDANREVTVSDPRLLGGQSYKALTRIWDDQGNVGAYWVRLRYVDDDDSPNYGDHLHNTGAGTCASGDGAPFWATNPTIGADGPTIPGTQLSVLDEGVTTGTGTVAKSYRWLKDGAAVSPTGSYTIQAGDADSTLTLEATADNGIGTPSVAEIPVAVTASEQPALALITSGGRVPWGGQGPHPFDLGEDIGGKTVIVFLAAQNDSIGGPIGAEFAERIYYSGGAQNRFNYAWRVRWPAGTTQVEFSGNDYDRIYGWGFYEELSPVKVASSFNADGSSLASLTGSLTTSLNGTAVIWGFTDGDAVTSGPADFTTVEAGGGENGFMLHDLATGGRERTLTVDFAGTGQTLMSGVVLAPA